MWILAVLTILSVAPLNITYKWLLAGRKEKIPSAEHLSDLNQPGSCYCGVANMPGYSERVVGGEDALHGQFPWQVALVRDLDPSRQFCGGALITTTHVLTAAHCTKDLSPLNVGVTVGMTNLTSSDSGGDQAGTVVAVREILNHPDYSGSRTNYADDISVLILSEVIDLHKSPLIKPVCLPSSEGSSSVYTGQSAVVSGWGLTDYYNGSYPLHLRHVQVSLLGKQCGQLAPFITDSQICAGHPQGGRDACQGDSGGPLVTRDPDNNLGLTVVGVVSAGSICGLQDYPGIYTDVKLFLSGDGWLSQVISGSDSCPPPPQTNQDIVDLTTTTPTTTTTTTSTTTTATSTNTRNLAVIVIGGSGYARGKKVEVWSPDGSCMKTLPDLPDFRSNHDSNLLNGEPTVCGGDLTLKSCLRLNIHNNAWEGSFQTRGYRSRHTMVSYGEGMLVLGGRWSDSVEWVYNQQASLLEGRVPRLESSCSVLTDRQSVITTGGVSAPSQTWEFHLLTGAWTELAAVPDGGRYKHSCTFISQPAWHGVMLAGGSDGLNLRPEAFFYDLARQRWFVLPHLPQPRWASRLVNLSDRIFLLGGGDGKNYIEDVYEFNLQTTEWLRTTEGLLYPRSDFSVVVVDEEYFGCEDEDEDIYDIIDPK